jgi:tetratricopeptide (TPR) repeat protein
VPDEVPYELLILWDEARNAIRDNNKDKAVEIYKYILLMYAEDPSACEYAHAYLSDLLLIMRKLPEAKEHIKKAIACNSRKPEYHYILGFIYLTESRWKPAVKQFKAALKEAPENAEYLRGLGWSTFNTGERQEGLLILNKALRIDPDNINILIDLAFCYMGMADFNKARKYIRMAKKLDPENALVRGSAWLIDYASHQAHMETPEEESTD